MTDPVSKKPFGDAYTAQEILGLYEQTEVGLTENDCEDLGFDGDACEILLDALVKKSGKSEKITPPEYDNLLFYGFAKEFVDALAGTDGRNVFRARAQFFADRILPQSFWQSEEETDKRWGAIHALGKLGPHAAVAVPNLIQILDEEKWTHPEWPKELVIKALITLGVIGPAAKEAIPAIIATALHQKRPVERLLEKIGFHEKENSRLRANARWALLGIGEDIIPEILKGMYEDKKNRLFFVEVFVELLERPATVEKYESAIAYAAHDIVPRLIEDLADMPEVGADPIVQSSYVNALSNFGEAAIPYLIDALSNNLVSERLAYALADTLAKIGSPAIPSLMNMYRGDGHLMAKAALKALRQMPPQAIHLFSSLFDNPDPWIRSSSIRFADMIIFRYPREEIPADFVLRVVKGLGDTDEPVVASAMTLLKNHAAVQKTTYFALPILYGIEMDTSRQESLRNLAKKTAHAIEEATL